MKTQINLYKPIHRCWFNKYCACSWKTSLMLTCIFRLHFIRIYFKMLFIPVVGEFLAAMQSSVSRDPSEIICWFVTQLYCLIFRFFALFGGYKVKKQISELIFMSLDNLNALGDITFIVTWHCAMLQIILFFIRWFYGWSRGNIGSRPAEKKTLIIKHWTLYQ